MKKYISLLVFVFCFVGNIWGQVQGTVTTKITNATCFGAANGIIEIKISGVTGPYDVILIRGLVEYGRVNNTTETDITFNNIPANTGYNIQIKVGASIKALALGLNVTQPTEFVQAKPPVAKDGGCGELGSISAQYTGGTTDYTFTLTSDQGYNQSVTQANGNIIFEGLTEGTYTLTANDLHNCKPFVTPGLVISSPLPVVGNIVAGSIIDVKCKGDDTGEATIEVQGGTAPYYFYLDGDFLPYDFNYDGISKIEGLSEGLHFVTIFDANNCTDDIPFSISEPANALTASISNIQNVTGCPTDATGQFTIDGQGGTTATGSYTYSIDGGSSFPKSGVSATFDQLGGGTYNIMVKDDNNCEYPTTQVITAPVPIDFTLTPTPNNCGGGSFAQIAISNTTGGTGAIQYQLEKGGTIVTPFQSGTSFTGLNAGDYTIRAKDTKNCENTKTVTLIDPAKVVVTVVGTTPVLCNGGNNGTITLSATGGNGTYEYSIDGGTTWQSGTLFNTSITAGTYTVKAKDGKNCESETTTATVSQPEQLTATATPTPTSCNAMTTPDGTITVVATGGTAPYTYSNGIASFVTSNLSYTFNSLAASTYSVTVTDVNGCATPATPVVVSEPVVITIASVIQTPNPILCPDDVATLTVNATGEPGRGFMYRINSSAESSWTTNNVFPNIIGGSYKIDVKYVDPWGSCAIATRTVLVSAPDPVEFTTINAAPLCAGESTGKITVNATGGTGSNYKYSITGPNTNITDQHTNVFNNLGAGIYTITVKDANNCSSLFSNVVLTAPAAITISNNTHTDVPCRGESTGTITVAASGGTGLLTYTLNTGASNSTGIFTGLPAGTYTVTVTDINNCVITTNIVIDEPEKIQFTAEPENKNKLLCDGETTRIIVTVTSPALGDFRYKLVGSDWQSSNIFDNKGPGTYTAEVAFSSAIGCSSQASQQVRVEDADLIEFNLDSVANQCNGLSNARIIINYQQGGTAPIEYRLDGRKVVDYGVVSSFDNLQGGSYTVTARDANGCTVSEGIDVIDPQTITINQTISTNVTCNGILDGTITVIALGGTTPLKYSISPVAGTNNNDGTFTGLPAGNYNVTVEDAHNCTPATTTVTITQPVALTVTTEQTVACTGNDGTAKVIPAGGTSPYGYSWKNASNSEISTTDLAIGLNAEAYAVTVTDNNGCTIVETVNILATDLAVTATATDITCSSKPGAINIVVTGGKPGYTYTVNNGPSQPLPANNIIDITSAGFYIIEVTDANGCKKTTPSIQIQEILLTATLEGTDVTCNNASDGKVEAKNVSGGVPTYNYAWANSTNPNVVISNSAQATGLTPGTYILTLTDSNPEGACTFTGSVSIIQPDAITVTVDKNDASCKDATDGNIGLTVSGGSGAYSYLWTGPTGFTATSKDISGLAFGNYSVTVTDANAPGCTSLPITATITEPTAITNINISSGTVACANETTTLTVTATGDPAETLAYSIDGTNWQQHPNNSFEVTAGSFTVYVGYWVSATNAKCVEQKPVTISGRAAITINKIEVLKPILDCNETSTTVTITATGGGAPGDLRYNMGGSWQTGNQFILQAGSYPVSAQYFDTPNCPVSIDTSVVIKKNIDIEITKVEVIGTLNCSDSNTASIIITANGPSGTLQYSIGNGWQAINQFNNLPAGDYPISVRYSENPTCPQEWGIQKISAPKSIVLAPSVVGSNALACTDSETTIDIVATDWETGRTVEYSINGTDWNTTGKFTTVRAGTYQVLARYQTPAPACQIIGETITITAPAAINIISATAFRTTLNCSNDTTTIRINASGENGYKLGYSIDNGTNWQSDNSVFKGVGKGNYQILVRYEAPASACQATGPAIAITAPDDIIISSFVSGDVDNILDCTGPGSVTTLNITASGSKPMEYSIDNGQTWAANNGAFTNVGVGSYMVCVRYVGSTCQSCFATEITLQSNSPIVKVTLSPVEGKLNCGGTSIPVTLVVDPATPASGSYQYSINSTSNWSNTVPTQLGMGVYVVYIRNANDPSCIQPSNSIMIKQPEPINIADVDINEAACFGEKSSILVTAYGDEAMTYTLTPSTGSVITNTNGSFTNISDGTYNLTVSYTDVAYSNCSATYPAITLAAPEEIKITTVVPGTSELKCAGTTTTLTVNATGSQALEYQLIDGASQATAWQDGNVFPVGAGTYTAQVRYKTTSPDKCAVAAAGANIITITEWAPIVLTVDIANRMLDCTQNNTTIKVTATGEAGKAFDFRINNTDPWVSNGTNEYIFTTGAGSYQVSARYQENTSCFVSQTETIDQNIGITIDQVIVGQTNLTCAGDTTSIRIKASGNGNPLQYTIDGSNWQSSERFPGVSAGTYNIKVRYQGEICSKPYGAVTISAPAAIQIDLVTVNGIQTNHVDLECNGDRATITIEATGSEALQYSIRNNEWLDGNIFSNIADGSYTAKVRYKNGGKCEVFHSPAITVFEPAAITMSVDVKKLNLDCAGQTTDITINATGEQKAGFELEYSLDGGTSWQASKDFLNKAAGTYQPRVRYKNHTTCTVASAANFTVTAPQAIVINSVAPVTSPLPCDGTKSKIDINVTSDPSLTLEYSLDNAAWTPNKNDLEAGTGMFTVYVRYATPSAACTAQASSSVASSIDITGVVATADKTNLTCESSDLAKITVAVTSYDNTKTLQYRINGSSWRDTPEFTNLGGGRYIVEASYKEDMPSPCSQASNAVIIIKPEPITNVRAEVDYGKTALNCNGDKTHITILADADMSQSLKYTLTINGVDMIQTNNNVFEVGAGTYTAKVGYADGSCEASYTQAIIITEPEAIKINTVTSSGPLSCESDKATLTVVITSSDTNRALEYSADGINWQSSNQLLVGPGLYNNIQVRYKQPDYPACAVIATQTFNIAAPDVINISHVGADKIVVDCDNPLDLANISVTAVSSNNTRTLEYSFDGGQTYQAGSSKQVASGSHKIWVRFTNAPNCPTEHPDAIVIQGNADVQFSNVAIANPISCNGGMGTITATVSSAANDVQMSIDGVTWVAVTAGTAHLFQNLTAGTYTIQARLQSKPACMVSTSYTLSQPDLIIASEISKTNATGCDTGSEVAGSVTIGVAGGTAPFAYQLNGDGVWHDFSTNTVVVSGLKSGSHTIQVRDKNACAATNVAVNITNPDIINIVASAVNIRCFGEANGQLTIRVTQGHTPFTVKITAPQAVQNNLSSPAYSQTFTIYNYSDALIIDDLYANYYMITATDANGCEKSREIRIKQPQGPLIADYQGVNICPNEQYGSIYPQTYGGYTDYTSYWYKEQTAGQSDYAPMFPDGSGNAIGGAVPVLDEIEAGKYAIAVVDQAMCSDTSYVEIIRITPMKVDGIRAHGVMCQSTNSGSIKIVNPQGGANGYYVYRVRFAGSGSFVPGYETYRQWNNDSITSLAQGRYLVDMADHQGLGCPPLVLPLNDPNGIVIGTESGLSIDKITVTDPKCFNNNDGKITSVKVTGSTFPLEYKLKYPNNIETLWQPTAVFDTISGGLYTLFVREKEGMGNGCNATKDTIIGGKLQIKFANIIVDSPACEKDPQGSFKFDAMGGTGNLTATYNGIAMSGTQTDVPTNTWHFEQLLVKGGKTTVRVTDANGCNDTIMRSIPYSTDLVIENVVIVPNKCPDDATATITVLAKDEMGAAHGHFVYELFKGDGTDAGQLVKSILQTILTSPVIFGDLANGSYTISVHDDRTPAPCYTLDSLVVIDNTSKINLTSVTVVNNDCNGSSNGRIIFTIEGEPSNTSYSYTINGSTARTVNAPGGIAKNVVIPNLIAGVYAVTINYGDCQYTQTFTVGVKFIVEPILTSHAATGCYGSANGSIDIEMADINGVPYTYWYNDLAPADFQTFSSSLKTTINSLRAGTYKLVVKQYGGCMSDTLMATVPDAPRLQITYTETVPISCKGNYGTIDISVTGGSGNYTPSVVPQSEGGYPAYAEAPVLSAFTLSNVTGGLYRIAVIDNGTGCKDTLDMNINAPRAVVIKASSPIVTCTTSQGQSTTITVQVIKPASGTFVYSINGSAGSPTTDLSTTWPGIIAGVYGITVTEQGSRCIADTTLTVSVPEPLVISPTVTPIDHGKCDYTASVVISVTNGTAPYMVYFNNNLITDYTITGLSDGTYPVRVVDANGCEKTESVTVALPKSIHVDATIRDVECNQAGNGSIVLTPATYSYSWANGATSNAIYDLNAGQYKVTISSGSCSVDSTFEVKASYTIAVAITPEGGDTHEFCPGAQVVLKGSVNINGTPLASGSTAVANWILPSGQILDYLSNNPLVITTITGKIQLVASSDKCTSSTTFEMSAKPVPTVIFATDTVYIPKDEVYILNIQTSEYISYQWTSNPDGYANDLPAPLAPVTLVSPDKAYSLILTLNGENKCPASDTIFVSQALDFFIPNAFTPNDDGIHDKWMFRHIEQYVDYYDIQVAVFNRGGIQVYSGNGYNNGSVVFDGRRNGNDLPIGTYYYVVKLVPKMTTGTSATQTFTGSVTIIR